MAESAYERLEMLLAALRRQSPGIPDIELRHKDDDPEKCFLILDVALPMHDSFDAAYCNQLTIECGNVCAVGVHARCATQGDNEGVQLVRCRLYTTVAAGATPELLIEATSRLQSSAEKITELLKRRLPDADATP